MSKSTTTPPNYRPLSAQEEHDLENEEWAPQAAATANSRGMKYDSKSAPATGQTAPVDPAKGNALLKKLFGSKLPIVPDPAPLTNPTQEK